MDYNCQRCSDRRETEITVTCQIGQEQISCVLRNIGVGGAFLLTDHPAIPGAKGEVLFDLPRHTRKIKADIEVVWTRNDQVNGLLFGMGVKFIRASIEDLTAIFEFIGEELLQGLE